MAQRNAQTPRPDPGIAVVIRVAAIGSGTLLIAVAFVAAFGVADTRQGLVAEVVTLLSGLAGTGLLIYGLVPHWASGAPQGSSRSAATRKASPRTANDLVLGIGGLLLAAVLLTGLAISGGWLWAGLGGVLLLPMGIGSAYLVAAFTRDPGRMWRIDLRRLSRRRGNSS
jgi:hypothetical protein